MSAYDPKRTCQPLLSDVRLALALYQRRKGTDQELIEFERAKTRVYWLAGWGLAHVLLRVNRRGCFFVRVFFHDDNDPFSHRGIVDRVIQ